MTKTILQKLRELKDEWVQFKDNVETLVTTTQEAVNNANKTMNEVQDTLDTIQNTLDDYGHFIRTLQQDYDSLRAKVQSIINNQSQPKKPWWVWWSK